MVAHHLGRRGHILAWKKWHSLKSCKPTQPASVARQVGFCKLVLDLFDWLARCDLWSAGMNRQQLARRNKQRPLASDLVLRSWQMALLCWRILLAGQLRLRCLLLDQRGKIQSQRETERKRLTDNFHLVLLVCLLSAVSFDK